MRRQKAAGFVSRFVIGCRCARRAVIAFDAHRKAVCERLQVLYDFFKAFEPLFGIGCYHVLPPFR